MLRITAAAVAIVIGATVVHAQNVEVVKQRRDVMQAIAKASSGNFAMMQGKAPFDLAKVQDGLKTMGAEGAKFKDLFPDDSKTGGETEASAKIWQAKADFNKAADALAAAVNAAQTSIKDEASLKAEYPKVARSCGGCHMETDGFAPRLADSFKRVK